MGRSAEKANQNHQNRAGIHDHACLSRREAARRLGTGPARVRTLVRRGGLKACTLCGRASRITIASIEAEEAWQAPLLGERATRERPEGLGEVLFGLVLVVVDAISEIVH